MTDLTILHNPRCSTSRAGLEAAQASGLSLEVRNYLREPLDEAAWLELLEILDADPTELVLIRSDGPRRRAIIGRPKSAVAPFLA